VLEEAGGPGAFYIDPDDVDAFAEAAMSVINDKDLRADMVAKGRAYTARFNHRAMAENIMATYRKALAQR
jgi:glycosyltransferase involved in cell wall biosynthesis